LTRNTEGANFSTTPGVPNPDMPGMLEPLSVELINERDASDRQARKDRLEAESRGWDGIYAS